MSFRCLPEATNNSSNGKRYSSETKMLFFFVLGAADTAPNISELLIRYFKTCWMVPIQDEVAADCRQALVFLTLQQWHMMRVHHSQIAGWLMKIPGFRLHRFTIPGWLENPWRFDKHPQTQTTATRWRHLETLPYTLGGSSMRHGVDDTHQDSGRCRHGVHFHHCSLVVPLDDLDVWITGGTPDTAIFVGHTITCPCVIINVARHLTKSFSYIIRNCGRIAHFFLVNHGKTPMFGWPSNICAQILRGPQRRNWWIIPIWHYFRLVNCPSSVKGFLMLLLTNTNLVDQLLISICTFAG